MWQYTWNGSAAQLWRFMRCRKWKLLYSVKLGTVLDIDAGVISQGRNVQTYALNESNAQNGNLVK